MPDLLLELFSEEIPARMQAQAARDLERMARERLAAAELPFRNMRAFAGPRRLTLAVDGLPEAQADRSEERRGPRANAPDKAVEGFLRSTGLTRDQLTERDGVLFATLHRQGRATRDLLAEMVGEIVRGFPWPKSMRSGAGTLRWVRPLKRILCLFDGEVVPVAIDLGAGEAIEASNLTEGHRFMGGDHAPFAVTGFEDYAERLSDHYVILDPAERRARIAAGCRAVCEARGLHWVEDEGLLDEVTGLAEWPVPVLGDMDAAFLDLPPEVIRTSMRVHQRYFAVRDPATGGLAPHFVVVANIEPKDGGAVIAHGNARVLTARLSDARFFWTEDQRAGNFERWAKKLEGVTFHAKLGTMAERVERIAALAREIAPLVGADPRLAEIAARLCKADLASGMVGEFPELQGVMGGYYVRAGGRDALPLSAEPDGSEDPLATVEDMVEPFPLEGGRAGMGVGNAALSEPGAAAGANSSPAAHPTPIPDPSPLEGEGSLRDLTPPEREVVADAVRDHYKPLGPSDSVPTASVTVAVALADKLDTLVGFFAIDERPTGSKDPFALRRAALGVIRLILSTEATFSVKALTRLSFAFIRRRLEVGGIRSQALAALEMYEAFTDQDAMSVNERDAARSLIEASSDSAPAIRWFELLERVEGQLPAFFADRLKVLLRDEGKRHDLVDAVFALGDDDLVRITRRVDALSAFLASEDGASLLAGYKRAANILKAEAKKQPGEDYALNWDLDALVEPEEQALSAGLRTVQGQVDAALEREDFAGAMRAFSHLRAPVDAFFERVLVNADDPAVRLNRLRLLTGVRDTANRIADFSLVASA
jgi:glycyl-tRNA synthetase beta chain